MAARELGSVLACTAMLALATGCAPISSITVGGGGRDASRVEETRRPGPPPHAPAHGYRYKQKRRDGRDIELVFDSGLGVYVVVGIPGRYYWDGYYLRIDGDQWYASVDLDGGWERTSTTSLPPGLQKKGRSAARGPKGPKPKKSHPAKGRW